MDLNVAVRKYLTYLSSIRNLAENSIESYKRDLLRLTEWIEKSNADWASLKRYQVRSFLGDFERAGLKETSINRSISAVKGFYDWCVKTEELPENPFAAVRSLKRGSRLPKGLFEEELDQLLEAPEGEKWLELRNRALLEFLYSTGCRAAEVMSLDVSSIDRSGGQVKVLGKGRKERIVFLTDSCKSVLKDYLVQRKERLFALGKSAEPALFINYRGGRLTTRGMRKILQKTGQNMELSGKLQPHALRHSFATHILDRGADIRVVQELLGHASLSTTQVYTRVGIDRLKDVYASAHPHGTGKIRKDGEE